YPIVRVCVSFDASGRLDPSVVKKSTGRIYAATRPFRRGAADGAAGPLDRLPRFRGPAGRGLLGRRPLHRRDLPHGGRPGLLAPAVWGRGGTAASVWVRGN